VAEPATTSSFQQRQCCFHQLDFKSHHQQPTTAAPLNKLPLRAAEILFLASCHREQHKQRPTSYLQPRVTFPLPAEGRHGEGTNNTRQDKQNREPEKERRGGSINQFFSSEPKKSEKEQRKRSSIG
jgi:hypothetical protein